MLVTSAFTVYSSVLDSEGSEELTHKNANKKSVTADSGIVSLWICFTPGSCCLQCVMKHNIYTVYVAALLPHDSCIGVQKMQSISNLVDTDRPVAMNCFRHMSALIFSYAKPCPPQQLNLI